ncbi:hypothetical protein QYZ87_02835 [Porphyromonadaceae bacterium W3.11]|nr:hypothetical protein [Porphyromonadaceae bacterium W3.11]
MNNKGYLILVTKSLTLLSSLLLYLLTCLGCNHPTPSSEKRQDKLDEEQLEGYGNRRFLVFDKGSVATDQGYYYEDASVGPRIYLFDKDNNLQQEVLYEPNQYVQWGYTSFLHRLPNEERLLLCSSMVRVNTRHNTNLPGFNPYGRVSVISSSTFELIKQKDFNAYSTEAQSFPDDIFAFDENSIYLSYRRLKKTYRVDLAKDPDKKIEVEALNGREIHESFIYNGKMYAFDFMDLDAGSVLVEFNPKNSSCHTKQFPNAIWLVDRADDLLYLSFSDGSVGVYSITERAFVIDPLKLETKMGKVHGMAYDRKEKQLYLAFNHTLVRPFIFKIDITSLTEDELSGKTRIAPVKFAKMDMLTSDPSSGRARLIVDKYQHKLFTFYYHSDKQILGGHVNIYDLDTPMTEGLQQHQKQHRIGWNMWTLTSAYFIPCN